MFVPARPIDIAPHANATRALPGHSALFRQGGPRLERHAFEDATQQAAAFDGWAVEYAQLSAGSFKGAFRNVDLGGVELILEEANQVLAQSGSVRPGTMVFGVPLSDQPDMYFNGRPWHRAIATSRGGREFGVRAAGSAMLLVSIDQSLLAQRLTQQGRALVDPFRHGLTFIDHPDLVQRFTHVASEAMAQCHNPLFQTTHTQSWLDMRERLIMLVLDLFEACDGRQRLTLAEQNKVSVVHRARQFINERIDQPLQVIDICEALVLSRRTLQQSFQDVLGINPQSYLRAHRLTGARHDLLQGGRGVQIKDVVARWGFWHLSRFSAEYRALFGELPSDTLKRL
jgi:AraC family ethanolamine operon transcriptional activator